MLYAVCYVLTVCLLCISNDWADNMPDIHTYGCVLVFLLTWCELLILCVRVSVPVSLSTIKCIFACACAQPQPCVGSGWDNKTTTNHNSWSETKTKTTTMWCISLPECLAGYKNHNHIQLRWVVSPRNTKTTIMDLVRPGCRHPGSRHKTRKS